MADAAEMTKSAKRRAAQKAREAAAAAAAAEAAAAEAATAAAAAKAKAKAGSASGAESKAKAKGKAKAEPNAEPKAAAKSEPAKAKGKAKAEAKEEPKEQPAAPASGAGAKAAAKGKAKAKKAPAEEEARPPVVPPEMAAFVQLDDGSGPAWEVSTTSKKGKKKDKSDAPADTQAPASGNQSKGDDSSNAPRAQAKAAFNPPNRAMTHLEEAQAEVERILNMKAAAPEVKVEDQVPEGPTATASVTVPEKKVGIVIGPKGAKIQMLQEKTGVTRIDTTGEIFTITGPPDSVKQCEDAIKELIEKGYCSIMYENFSESFVNVHPSSFPDIIGKQGSVVRKIKDELNVEVSIPEVPKGSPPAKKFKVSLAGSVENVEKAKTVINDIVMYGHSDLTHPDQVHEELDIEARAYRYIIGRGGSEMKHIQHNWSVRVNIPREHSANDKVLIIGDKDNVERAKAYVEKLIWNAENAAKGRDKEDAAATGDHWGEEGAEEEWMKGYVYKR